MLFPIFVLIFVKFTLASLLCCLFCLVAVASSLLLFFFLMLSRSLPELVLCVCAFLFLVLVRCYAVYFFVGFSCGDLRGPSSGAFLLPVHSCPSCHRDQHAVNPIRSALPK